MRRAGQLTPDRRARFVAGRRLLTSLVDAEFPTATYALRPARCARCGRDHAGPVIDGMDAVASLAFSSGIAVAALAPTAAIDRLGVDVERDDADATRSEDLSGLLGASGGPVLRRWTRNRGRGEGGRTRARDRPGERAAARRRGADHGRRNPLPGGGGDRPAGLLDQRGVARAGSSGSVRWNSQASNSGARSASGRARRQLDEVGGGAGGLSPLGHPTTDGREEGRVADRLTHRVQGQRASLVDPVVEHQRRTRIADRDVLRQPR